MKKLVFGLFLSTCLFTSIQAQVKIGENPQNLDANSVLELESTNKALVITRLSTLQMDAMTPLNGALIYNTDTNCVHYYNGTIWINLCEAENAGDINLVENPANTFTFTNAAGVETVFETPEFTNNYTGSGASSITSGIKVTDDGNTVNIEVFQLDGASILDGTISGAKITDDAIKANHIGDNEINNTHIADNSLSAVKIAPGAESQVLKTQGGTTVWGTLDATSIAGQDLTADTSIALTGTPTGSLLETVGISVADGGITNAKLAANAVTTDKIADETILSEDILDGAIATLDIADDAIITSKIADANVTTSKIANGTANQVLKTNNAGDGVEWGALDANNITGQDLTADASITLTGTPTGSLLETVGISVADGGITVAKLAADAVTTDKIVNETILSEDILDGTIATLDVADNAITADKINADVAGSGLTKNTTTGALDVDVTALTGDGNITSTDLNVTGDTNALLGDVNLEINPSAVGANEIADKNITLTKLADGTAVGQLMQWNGTGWVLVDATTLTADGLIGNEVTGPTDATLVVSGSGTVADPLTLDVSAGGINTDELADNAVTTVKITDANVTRDKIADLAINDAKLDKTNISLSGFAVPTGDLSIGSQKLTNVLNPTDAQDAATKFYVDAAVTAGTTALALKEDSANKSNDGTLVDNSVTDFPTEQAVKTYVDSKTVSGTTGSIFFADATGQATENNSQLFWDNTNNRLGIGRTNPQDKLDVEGQIRARDGFAATGGTVGQPSYGFYTNGDTNTGMFRIAEDQIGFSTAGIQAITIDATQNVGIGTTSPNSTLHTGGSLATAILTTTGNLTLSDIHHTIIIGSDGTIALPAASTCQGRIYIIKNPDTATITASPDYSVTFTPGSSYLDSMGNNNPTSLPAGITKLQSDGTNWQQIN
ncbi:beta strand repeat-containing protein [Cellulophaga fucicola]|uniref:Collagen triple helix repeat-containing protein n=1 Tax=Cellulophaga fucicola TaxID=76595 RepID=A0A1K1R8G7_9FLAO|nr:hypothetical protein [Cellulophaga fucicola]SFW68204.1 hypothetical protein SAMN05660313_03385 [Cellulophaga fucicola]